VRAGHLRLAVTHLAFFPFPPCHPPEGEFPPATPSGGSRGRARAFLCSSPVTAPAFSLPCSGKGGASPFLCPRSGTALAFPRAVFSFPGRKSLVYPLVSCSALVSLICSVGGQRCSRRGRAAASLPAGSVHRLPHRSPPPSLAGVIVRRVRAAHRPSGRWHPRPSAPEGLPPCLRGRPDDRCAATGPPLRHIVLFPCPVPADFAALRLPVLGRCSWLRDRINPRTLHSAASVWCSGPSADRRSALTALALRFSVLCPLPERHRFARTHRVSGFP